MSVGINELYDMLDSDDEEIQQRGIEEGARWFHPIQLGKYAANSTNEKLHKYREAH